MEKQQKKFSEILQKLKENNDFIVNDIIIHEDIDDTIEDFRLRVPGWPGTPDVKWCWPVLKRGGNFLDPRDYHDECATTPGIPGWNGIDINIEIPSMDKYYNDMIEKIKSDLISPIENTFKSILDATKKGVQDLIDNIKREFQESITKITDGFNDAIKKINEWFQNLGNQLNAIFSKIADFFNKMERSFTQMGKGLGNIFTGLLVDGPQGLGEGLSKGFTDIGVLLFWAGEYFFSNMKCGVHFIQNLNICFSYYVLDTIRFILYSPVTFIKWLVWEVGGHDLTDFENQIWSYIYDIDMMTGIHAFKYSKDINNRCYNCKRLKVLALKNKSNQINYDFMKKMPILLNKGSDRMKKGGDEFLAAF
jgi:hypothetical protein